MTETNKPLMHNKDTTRSYWSQYVRTYARGTYSSVCIAERVKKKTGTKWDRDQPRFIRVAGRNRANKKGADTSFGATGAFSACIHKTHQRASAAVSRYFNGRYERIELTRAGKDVRPLCSRAGIELEHKDAAASLALAVPNRREAA